MIPRIDGLIISRGEDQTTFNRHSWELGDATLLYTPAEPYIDSLITRQAMWMSFPSLGKPRKAQDNVTSYQTPSMFFLKALLYYPQISTARYSPSPSPLLLLLH